MLVTNVIVVVDNIKDVLDWVAHPRSLFAPPCNQVCCGSARSCAPFVACKPLLVGAPGLPQGGRLSSPQHQLSATVPPATMLGGAGTAGRGGHFPDGSGGAGAVLPAPQSGHGDANSMHIRIKCMDESTFQLGVESHHTVLSVKEQIMVRV